MPFEAEVPPVAIPSFQDVLNLLLGPFGTTVLLVLIAVAFLREWVYAAGRLRASEKREADLLALLSTLAGGVDAVAKATEDRNRLEVDRREQLRSSGVSAGLSEAEELIVSQRRRRPRPNA